MVYLKYKFTLFTYNIITYNIIIIHTMQVMHCCVTVHSIIHDCTKDTSVTVVVTNEMQCHNCSNQWDTVSQLQQPMGCCDTRSLNVRRMLRLLWQLDIRKMLVQVLSTFLEIIEKINEQHHAGLYFPVGLPAVFSQIIQRVGLPRFFTLTLHVFHTALHNWVAYNSELQTKIPTRLQAYYPISLSY